MDLRLKAFLELVDCRPDEVHDIRSERPSTTDTLKADHAHGATQARRDSLGEKKVYFGKHKGKKLKDIPPQYLEWVLGEQPTTNSFRKFQRQVNEFLARAVGSAGNVNPSAQRQAI
jgi:hypothetical protein